MPNIDDPSDQMAYKAVSRFLAKSQAPPASTYEVQRVDLDSDGRRDALVMFKTPYGYWCGMHGCTMLIMKAHNDRFELVNSIQPVRGPLYIGQERTNGWQDLILRVSGRWNESRNVPLQFDGKSYPLDPSTIDYNVNVNGDLNNYAKVFY